MRQAAAILGLTLLGMMFSVACGASCNGGSCGTPSGTPSGTPIGIQGDTRYGSSLSRGEGDPSPRYLAALAYDVAHDDYVLFGGQTRTGTSGETWILRRTGSSAKRPAQWTQAKPQHNPSPRRDAAMAWDPIGHVVLMYGGLVPDHAEGFEASDTWAWNGSDWKQVADEAGPGARDGARMVTAGGRVLLFGGHVANIKYFADMWSWDGARWVAVDARPTPPARGDTAMVWTPQSSSVIIFGGRGAKPDAGPGNSGTPLQDAWRFKDGTWSELPAGPPSIGLPTASAHGTIDWIMSGVTCPADKAVAWKWDGQSWRDVGPTNYLWGAATAAGPDGTAVQFGGSSEPAC